MTRKFLRGLVIGKFCPLHLGHEYLIRSMLEHCGEGFILSYTNPELPGCEPSKRRHWLKSIFPHARILVLDAREAPPNAASDRVQRQFIARICEERLQATVDAVFTSEDYGDGLAMALSRRFGHAVHHVSVDPLRTRHPVSGTALRADIHANRNQLSPIVYADFVQRICLLGGESSGKSTLAAALAGHFRTRHVPEYGRELWESKSGRLEFDDMVRIARTQTTLEQSLAVSCTRFLFCDTSPLTTLFYSQHLFGRADPELEVLAEREYALYVLCAPDFPFVQDGTREDADFRDVQHAWYRAELRRRGLRWVEARGTLPERIRQLEAQLASITDSCSPMERTG